MVWNPSGKDMESIYHSMESTSKSYGIHLEIPWNPSDIPWNPSDISWIPPSIPWIPYGITRGG
jgi:hypothetical protein